MHVLEFIQKYPNRKLKNPPDYDVQNDPDRNKMHTEAWCEFMKKTYRERKLNHKNMQTELKCLAQLNEVSVKSTCTFLIEELQVLKDDAAAEGMTVKEFKKAYPARRMIKPNAYDPAKDPKKRAKKQRRYRPGTVALREIRQYQKSTDLLIRKHALVR